MILGGAFSRLFSRENARANTRYGIPPRRVDGSKRRHKSVRRGGEERSTANFRNVRERKGTPCIEDEDGLIIYTSVQLCRECDNKRFDVYERAC